MAVRTEPPVGACRTSGTIILFGWISDSQSPPPVTCSYESGQACLFVLLHDTHSSTVDLVYQVPTGTFKANGYHASHRRPSPL